MLHHRIPYLSGEAGSVALVHNAAVLDSGPRITMHQPQQRQDMPKPTCTRCGGIGFFHTPIADPTTGRIPSVSVQDLRKPPVGLGRRGL